MNSRESISKTLNHGYLIGINWILEEIKSGSIVKLKKDNYKLYS
ncbi:MAG: hypothetical protein ACFFA0_05510 [Promethearchaeota archaeon]